MARSRSRRHLVASAVAVVTMAAFGPAAAGSTAAAEPAPADGSQASITVDGLRPLGRLPADFVGLSYEMRELSLGSFDAGTGNLVQLFRNLGRSNVRIGGNTLDRDTLWVPAGQQPPQPLPPWVQNVVTPADIGRLGRFLRATGWRSEVGINVGRFDRALAADQARTLSGKLGRYLAAVECGNEPNSWVSKGFKTPPYGYPQYRPDWEACADVVGSNRIAGPDTSSPTSTVPFVTQFAHDQRSRINMLTVHTYSVGSGAGVLGLLSPQTYTKQFGNVAALLAAAKAEGVPIRIDETNSAAGGGIEGVSDTYASALWSMDYSLQLAREGFDGLNFHGGLGVCGAPLYNGKFQHYTPICAANEDDEKAKTYIAAPEYYGLYMASRMGPGRFLPVNVATDRNITAYAVRGDDGRTRIAVIEKDGTSAAPVRVSVAVGRQSGTGEVVRLTGTSLESTEGVAIQGASVDRRGRLARRPGDRVRIHQGTLTVDVASGSAAIITLERGC